MEARRETGNDSYPGKHKPMERSAIHNSLIGIPQIDLNNANNKTFSNAPTLVRGGGSINSLEEFDNYLFNGGNKNNMPGSSAGRVNISSGLG